MTAEEIMAQLAQDPDYQRRMAAQDAELQARAKVWRQAEQPIVADLRKVGVEVRSVWDLVNTAEPYPTALPVLMEHLERGGYPDRVLEGVARALAVKPSSVYWQRLRDLYVRAEGPDVSQGLAAALAAAARPEHVDDMLALLADDALGANRIFFLRPIFKLGGDRGRQAIEDLQTHPVLGREAAAVVTRRKKK